MTVYNGELIVSGVFDMAGDVAVHNIARWDGVTWRALGDDVALAWWQNRLYAYNGSLIVSAAYDGSPNTRFAQWASTNPQSAAIGRHPMSRNVTAGSRVSFAVEATGCPVPYYRWRKNGGDLSDRPGLHGADAATLVIDAVTPDDAGLYDCIVDNGVGAVTSRAARLRVR
jgi:hypothetical protein